MAEYDFGGIFAPAKTLYDEWQAQEEYLSRWEDKKWDASSKYKDKLGQEGPISKQEYMALKDRAFNAKQSFIKTYTELQQKKHDLDYNSEKEALKRQEEAGLNPNMPHEPTSVADGISEVVPPESHQADAYQDSVQAQLDTINTVFNSISAIGEVAALGVSFAKLPHEIGLLKEQKKSTGLDVALKGLQAGEAITGMLRTGIQGHALASNDFTDANGDLLAASVVPFNGAELRRDYLGGAQTPGISDKQLEDMARSVYSEVATGTKGYENLAAWSKARTGAATSWSETSQLVMDTLDAGHRIQQRNFCLAAALASSEMQGQIDYNLMYPYSLRAEDYKAQVAQSLRKGDDEHQLAQDQHQVNLNDIAEAQPALTFAASLQTMLDSCQTEAARIELYSFATDYVHKYAVDAQLDRSKDQLALQKELGYFEIALGSLRAGIEQQNVEYQHQDRIAQMETTERIADADRESRESEGANNRTTSLANTAMYTFGGAFMEAFQRLSSLFSLGRGGYSAPINPNQIGGPMISGSMLK